MELPGRLPTNAPTEPGKGGSRQVAEGKYVFLGVPRTAAHAWKEGTVNCGQMRRRWGCQDISDTCSSATKESRSKSTGSEEGVWFLFISWSPHVSSESFTNTWATKQAFTFKKRSTCLATCVANFAFVMGDGLRFQSFVLIYRQ